jgi:hypothetical protein
MSEKIPSWKIIWLSSSECIRALDGKPVLASRVIAVISGQQRAGINDENTGHQQDIWEYLVQNRQALRPRYILDSADKRRTEIFKAQKKKHILKLWDDYWNARTWINDWGRCVFKKGVLLYGILDDLFATKKKYENFWMENGIWYGQLTNWKAEDISAEVNPQIDRFIESNLFAFRDTIETNEIPKDHHWFFQRMIYSKTWSSFWLAESSFKRYFSEQHPTLQAALRYEMIRWTDEMVKIARTLKKPKKEEQAIADIIRGVRAFNPIDEEETIVTPKEFKIPQWADWS